MSKRNRTFKIDKWIKEGRGAGVASAASLASLSPGSSTNAVPVGVAALSLQSNRTYQLVREWV